MMSNFVKYGAEDLLVPPSMSDIWRQFHVFFFSFPMNVIWRCLRLFMEVLKVLFPQKVDWTPIEEVEENSDNVIFGDTKTEEWNVSRLTTDSFW